MSFKKKIISSALAAVMVMSAYAPVGEGVLPVSSEITASAATAAAPAQVTMKDYTSDAASITLSWAKVKGAAGYRVYRLVDGSYKKVTTITKNTATYKVTGLEAASEYTFKVRAYTKTSSGNLWGKCCKAYKAITAPVSSSAYKIKSVSVNAPNSDAASVKIKWGKTACRGYAIYLYDNREESWVKVADVTDPTKTSATFYYYKKSKFQKKYLYEVYAGGANGYKFCVRPYSKDSAGTKTVYAKCWKAKEAYFDITELEYAFGDEYTLLSKQLPKAKADDAPDYYYTYITEKDKKTGAISSTKTKSYVSEASRKAYEDFANTHFGKDWTDAQKIMYTLNWINKNNVYDTKYAANAGGCFANVTVQKLGQCNSYNGAIAEMLTIMGYKGHYMQCMTPSVREWQHYRTEIKIDKTTYSFESGEPGWLWLFRKYDEVPLSKKAAKES